MYTLRERRAILDPEDKIIGVIGIKGKVSQKIKVYFDTGKRLGCDVNLCEIPTVDGTVEHLMGSDVDKISIKPSVYFRAYSDGAFVGYVGDCGAKTRFSIFIAVFVLILVVVGLGIKLLSQESGSISVQSSSSESIVETFGDIQTGELSFMTLEEKKALAQQLIDNSRYEIRAQTKPVFRDGKLNICVENNELNTISVKIAVLNKDDKEVYYSQKLEPGQYIEWATLTESIDAGEASLRFDFLDDNDEVYQSSFVKLDVQIP